MAVKKLQIKWDIKAKETLKEIFDYYKLLSPQAAKNIKNDILDTVKTLNILPEKYPVDPYLGAPYRFAIAKHYKIIYLVREKDLLVLSIFDARQAPEKLKELRS